MKKEKEWPAKKASEREESVHTKKDNMEIFISYVKRRQRRNRGHRS